MSPKPEYEAPNVVSEDGFRERLTRGYHVDVMALEDAHKRASYWYGQWIVRCVAPDGSEDCLLVLSRTSISPRIFKTANGLISFLYDVGCTSVHVLLKKGLRSRHVPKQD